MSKYVKIVSGGVRRQVFLREAHFMKKALIGTTALVAASLMSGAALAADPIKLGLSGNFRAMLGYANQDDGTGQAGAGRRNFGIGHDSKINFQGKTTLDNGIEVGVVIELEPESDARGATTTSGNQTTLGEVDVIDEAYIYLENQNVWGRVEMGDRDGAVNKMHNLGPFVLGTSIVGVATMQAVTAPTGNAAANPVFSPAASDSTKITYYTPRFGGLQLGASYTPDNVENVGRFGVGIAAVDSHAAATGVQGDIMEISANYVMTFGKLGVRANAGYWKGDQESTAVGMFDQKLWAIGGQLTYGAWAFGGGYIDNEAGANTGGAGNRKTDDNQIRLGLTYSWGPWLAGLEYSKREVDQTTGGSDDVTIWGLAARRTLGPGVTMGAGIRRWDWEDSAPTATRTNENEAVEFVVETSFTF